MVILGDSITSGYGIDPAKAYPALLQKLADSDGIPARIINAGISGDTTSGGLARTAWALQEGADVLVIALGGNDGLRGIPTAVTRDNLLKMIARARSLAPGIQILLAGMRMPESMGREYALSFSQIFPEVAAETQSELFPFLLEGIAADPEFNQPDLIHPTDMGQQIIATNLWPVLRKLLETP